MQGTEDRTFELGTTTGHEHERGTRRRTLVGGALALALLAGGATAAALAADSGAEPRTAADTLQSREAPAAVGQVADAPDSGAQAPVGGAQAPDSGAQAPVGGAGTRTGTDEAPEQDSDGGAVAAPAAGGSRDAVPAGTYGARVLGEGWDARGRYVLVDRGRLTDGPAAEPGVDGTRPVVFDTGAVAERRRLDLADDHQFRFSRSGGEPSYGSGSWADFVTELSGRDAGMLATVQVDGDGRLTRLEEPYRP